MPAKSAMKSARRTSVVKKKVSFYVPDSALTKGRFYEFEKKVKEAEKLKNGLDTQMRQYGQHCLIDLLGEMRLIDGYDATLTALKYK